RLLQLMGGRLDWDRLALGNSPKMIWRMARPYLPGATVAAVVLVAGYALALRGIQRWRRSSRVRMGAKPPAEGPVADRWQGWNSTCNSQPATGDDRERATACGSAGLWYAMASFALLGWLGLAVGNPDQAEGQAGVRLAQTSPWWKRMVNRTLGREEFLRAASDLGLGDFGAEQRGFPAAARRELNVLLVFMESAYNQHLSLFGASEETQPRLSKYKERMEIFPNFFSNFASSIHARFAAFTGLYPVRDFNAFTLERVPVKSLFEVLHDHGYAC